MNKNKTRDELIKMYIDSLKEDNIPWRQRWINQSNINGISKIEYKGINQLLLNYVTYKEKYNDNRWFTYKQIEDMGLKLRNAKNKGVPVEFWSFYNIKLKKKFNIDDYNKYIEKYPDKKDDFKLFSRTAIVFNGSLVENLPNVEQNKRNINLSKYITNLINKLNVSYEEKGNKAYYDYKNDSIVLPNKNSFIDEYSYYATQLHEISHATGNSKRLNRNLSNNKEEYAREELVAEISSSFLMQNLNIPANANHYDNHKAYIKSWIDILENKPNELFEAINKSNMVVNYINGIIKEKEIIR